MNEVVPTLSGSSSIISDDMSSSIDKLWPEITNHIHFGDEDIDMSYRYEYNRFLPPPPRPDFLESSVDPDGVTTCDLCSWARSLDKNEAAGELGWVLTLIIVSMVSAAVGAVIMVTLLHCRRKDSGRSSDFQWWPCSDNGMRGRCVVRGNGGRETCVVKGPMPKPQSPPGWTRFARPRRAALSPVLRDTISSRTQNHYTHVLDAAHVQSDTLYAELDRVCENSVVPAYQNSAYADIVEPVTWSATSSAYYSDLSVCGNASNNERPYEMVDVVPTSPSPAWLECESNEHRPVMRLAAISEVAAVASEYV